MLLFLVTPIVSLLALVAAGPITTIRPLPNSPKMTGRVPSVQPSVTVYEVVETSTVMATIQTQTHVVRTQTHNGHVQAYPSPVDTEIVVPTKTTVITRTVTETLSAAPSSVAKISTRATPRVTTYTTEEIETLYKAYLLSSGTVVTDRTSVPYDTVITTRTVTSTLTA